MESVDITIKPLLTINEASRLYGIGTHKLRELISSDNCQFVLYVGKKALIKRNNFDSFLTKAYSI